MTLSDGAVDIGSNAVSRVHELNGGMSCLAVKTVVVICEERAGLDVVMYIESSSDFGGSVRLTEGCGNGER